MTGSQAWPKSPGGGALFGAADALRGLRAIKHAAVWPGRPRALESRSRSELGRRVVSRSLAVGARGATSARQTPEKQRETSLTLLTQWLE